MVPLRPGRGIAVWHRTMIRSYGSRRPKDLYLSVHYPPVTTTFAVLKHRQSSAFALMPVFHRDQPIRATAVSAPAREVRLTPTTFIERR